MSIIAPALCLKIERPSRCTPDTLVGAPGQRWLLLPVVIFHLLSSHPLTLHRCSPLATERVFWLLVMVDLKISSDSQSVTATLICDSGPAALPERERYNQASKRAEGGKHLPIITQAVISVSLDLE